jgi:hypothetical protein
MLDNIDNRKNNSKHEGCKQKATTSWRLVVSVDLSEPVRHSMSAQFFWRNPFLNMTHNVNAQILTVSSVLRPSLSRLVLTMKNVNCAARRAVVWAVAPSIATALQRTCSAWIWKEKLKEIELTIVSEHDQWINAKARLTKQSVLCKYTACWRNATRKYWNGCTLYVYPQAFSKC